MKTDIQKKVLIDILNWLSKDDSKYAILYGADKRFCTNDEDLTTEELVDLYIESLQNKR